MHGASTNCYQNNSNSINTTLVPSNSRHLCWFYFDAISKNLQILWFERQPRSWYQPQSRPVQTKKICPLSLTERWGIENGSEKNQSFVRTSQIMSYRNMSVSTRKMWWLCCPFLWQPDWFPSNGCTGKIVIRIYPDQTRSGTMVLMEERQDVASTPSNSGPITLPGSFTHHRFSSFWKGSKASRNSHSIIVHLSS